ncbi:MAG: tetratricopeptide repeat protein [Luteibaculaceae bacterium]
MLLRIVLLLFILWHGSDSLKAQKLSLQDTLVRIQLAKSLEYEEKQEWIMAAQTLENIAKIATPDFMIWFKIGEYYRLGNEPRKSLEAYKNSLKFEENNLIKYYIAQGYAKLNNKDECLNWLEKSEKGALNIYPYLQEDSTFTLVTPTERYKSLSARLLKNNYPCLTHNGFSMLDTLKSSSWVITSNLGMPIGNINFTVGSGNCSFKAIAEMTDESQLQILLYYENPLNQETLSCLITDSKGKTGVLDKHSKENDIISFDKKGDKQVSPNQYESFSIAKKNNNVFKLSLSFKDGSNSLVNENYTLTRQFNP